MPTRVVLHDAPSALRRESSSSHLQHGAFRSTLMRSVIEPSSNSQTAIYTSATDIRASPRLAGYLYMLIASVVMIASVAQFYKNDNLASAFFNDLGYIKEQEFILIAGTRVFRWKFIGAFVIACVGTLFSLLILLVHFDTFCFPRFWRKFFRDGSIYERNLLIVAIIYWAAGVHICTSSFSIGATQANVYFTTWIVFIASALNYDMWRLGADMPNLSEFVSSQRKTTVTCNSISSLSTRCSATVKTHTFPLIRSTIGSGPFSSPWLLLELSPTCTPIENTSSFMMSMESQSCKNRVTGFEQLLLHGQQLLSLVVSSLPRLCGAIGKAHCPISRDSLLPPLSASQRGSAQAIQAYRVSLLALPMPTLAFGESFFHHSLPLERG